MLKRTLTSEAVIEYQRERAKARRTIKHAKKKYWRDYCDSIGKETELGEVWNMLKKMIGIYKTRNMPVISGEGKTAITEKDKAELLVKTFQKAHSKENLDENYRMKRQEILNQHQDIYTKRPDGIGALDADFEIWELKRVLYRIKRTAPGQDGICYIMLKYANDRILKVVLDLYNKIWVEGRMPRAWKHAIIIPIAKPGKDASIAGNYRPIALTSNLCKLMEKIIVNRLNYVLESKGALASNQYGFRKGRSTLDALVKLETDVKKAIAVKEGLVAVYFDMEKAYDMLWKEGLLIKMKRIGIEGRMFNWVLSFLFDRTIQVQVGSEVSQTLSVENGTPQGSVISPILFNIMINDIFGKVAPGISTGLYADDGIMWKRGRNISFNMDKIQEAIEVVGKWSLEWGFRFSISKTCYQIFTRKKIKENKMLTLYGSSLEKVSI